MSEKRPKKVIEEWFFDIKQTSETHSNELCFGRTKAFLYESLHHNISNHKLKPCYQILKLLAQDTSLDPYVLFRFIMILVESNKTERISKNVIIHLESVISKLDVSKPDILVEFLSYLIRNNRIEDARDLFVQRHIFRAYRSHRPIPFVDVNLRCYEFLLNYLNWDSNISQDVKVKFNISIQGWIVNAIDSLKMTESNHEYFVMCVIRILLFYGYYKKAYLFSSEFQRNNQNNYGAQVLHKRLIEWLYGKLGQQVDHDGDSLMESITSESERIDNRINDLIGINNFTLNMEEEMFELSRYPLQEEKKTVFENLHRLDPRNLDHIRPRANENIISTFTSILDGLEYVEEIRNVERWKKLKRILTSITKSNDEALLTDAKFIWRTRYKRYWNSIDFVHIAYDYVSSKSRKLIEELVERLKNELEFVNA